LILSYEGINIYKNLNDKAFLLFVSKALVLVSVEGWQNSWGIQQELQFCQENQIPVYKIAPDEITTDLSRVLAHSLEHHQVKALLKVV
jgi:hypothetical protein